MNDMRSIIAETIIGFGSGIIVGSGLVALLTVLGIIPRLVQLSKSYTFVKSYQAAVILGGIIGTLFFPSVKFRSMFPYLSKYCSDYSMVFLSECLQQH